MAFQISNCLKFQYFVKKFWSCKVMHLKWLNFRLHNKLFQIDLPASFPGEETAPQLSDYSRVAPLKPVTYLSSPCCQV